MSNKPVAEALKHVLADSYVLYLKTQNFHWNVTGPHFRSLHLLFEEEYTDLQAAVDDIAERIRTLGEAAPGSFKEFLSLTHIKEANGGENAETMVKTLADDQEIIISDLKKLLEAAQKAGDEGTIGLVTDRLSAHEKNLWMLRSSV